MLTQWYFLTVAMAVAIIPAAICQVCDGRSEESTMLCTDLLNDIERALLEDESNLSRMRTAFYHSPTASPVLIKVVYNLTFAENLKFAVDNNEISHCSTSTANSSVEFVQQNVTYGWTSSGVYTAFHPIILNMMQAHTPFAVLRIIHQTLDQRGPEADTFLWDGSYNLPTLRLNLHVSSISCAPSKALFYSVLEDFNTLLKVYAGHQDKLRFMQEQDSIGFTLPSSSVSTNIDPNGSDVVMAILYSFAFCFMYLLSVLLFFFWYFCQRGSQYRKRQEEEEEEEAGRPRERRQAEGGNGDIAKDDGIHIDDRFQNNKELIGGMLMTAVIAIAFEFCVRITNCIIWTVHIDNSLGIFKAVWLPQMFLFFFATTTNICGHAYICIKKWGKANRSAVDRFNNTITSKVHIMLALQLTVFGLLYCFFPAIILIFAYPTRMIAIFTFVPAYLFATTIVVSILIKFFRLCKHNPNNAEQNGAAANENDVEARENDGGQNGGEAPENDKGARENDGGARENDRGGRENDGGAQGLEENEEAQRNERGAQRNEEGVSIFGNEGVKILKFLVALVIACILMFFVYAIILTFLYSVIIGRGSVVNTGPLFIVSLIPSILIMIAAWIAERILLNGSRNICSCMRKPEKEPK